MNKMQMRCALAGLFLIGGCTDSSLITDLPDTADPGTPPELKTQVREISDIEAVVLSGAGVLFIERGDRAGLRVRSEQQVLDRLYTEVTGAELTVGFSESFSLDHPMVLECFLTVTQLEKLHLTGLWRVEASDLQGSALSVQIDGLGEVDLISVDLPFLSVNNGGPGDVAASGRATAVSVELRGGGGFFGGSLISDEASIFIRSSGSATVNVNNQLAADISGKGSVFYFGDPVVSRTGEGSGQAERLGG